MRNQSVSASEDHTRTLSTSFYRGRPGVYTCMDGARHPARSGFHVKYTGRLHVYVSMDRM
jgi:hypothetical protein